MFKSLSANEALATIGRPGVATSSTEVLLPAEDWTKQ